MAEQVRTHNFAAIHHTDVCIVAEKAVVQLNIHILSAETMADFSEESFSASNRRLDASFNKICASLGGRPAPSLPLSRSRVKRPATRPACERRMRAQSPPAVSSLQLGALYLLSFHAFATPRSPRRRCTSAEHSGCFARMPAAAASPEAYSAFARARKLWRCAATALASRFCFHARAPCCDPLLFAPSTCPRARRRRRTERFCGVFLNEAHPVRRVVSAFLRVLKCHRGPSSGAHSVTRLRSSIFSAWNFIYALYTAATSRPSLLA